MSTETPGKISPSEEEKELRAKNPTLAQRGSVYGSYQENVLFRSVVMAQAKRQYSIHHEGEEMPTRYQVMISDIVMKLARIAVSPNHVDSWHDIVGYGQLIENSVKEMKNE